MSRPEREVSTFIRRTDKSEAPSKEDKREKYDSAMKAKWVELAQEGKFVREIAEATGLDDSQQQNIRNHLRRMNVVANRERGDASNSEAAKPVRRIVTSQPTSAREAAKRFLSEKKELIARLEAEIADLQETLDELKNS